MQSFHRVLLQIIAIVLSFALIYHASNHDNNNFDNRHTLSKQKTIDQLKETNAQITARIKALSTENERLTTDLATAKRIAREQSTKAEKFGQEQERNKILRANNEQLQATNEELNTTNTELRRAKNISEFEAKQAKQTIEELNKTIHEYTMGNFSKISAAVKEKTQALEQQSTELRTALEDNARLTQSTQQSIEKTAADSEARIQRAKDICAERIKDLEASNIEKVAAARKESQSKIAELEKRIAELISPIAGQTQNKSESRAKQMKNWFGAQYRKVKRKVNKA